MAMLQESKENLENKLMLHMMSYIESDPEISQRALSIHLGVASGLVNSYLKRCIQKGLIKVQNIPTKRYAYYLTPKGFLEKTKLTVDYLKTSFNFFREAQNQFINLFQHCEQKGYQTVFLVGLSELTEMATQIAKKTSLNVIVVSADEIEEMVETDCIIITDINTPQMVFDSLIKRFPSEQILTPSFLHISRINRKAEVIS